MTGACIPASSLAAKQPPFRIKVHDEAISSTGHLNLLCSSHVLIKQAHMSRRSPPVSAFGRLAIGDRTSMPTVTRSQHRRNLAASQQGPLGQAAASSSTRPSTRQQRGSQAASTEAGNTGDGNDDESRDDDSSDDEGSDPRDIVLQILSAFDPGLLMPSELTSPVGRRMR